MTLSLHVNHDSFSTGQSRRDAPDESIGRPRKASQHRSAGNGLDINRVAPKTFLLSNIPIQQHTNCPRRNMHATRSDRSPDTTATPRQRCGERAAVRSAACPPPDAPRRNRFAESIWNVCRTEFTASRISETAQSLPHASHPRGFERRFGPRNSGRRSAQPRDLQNGR